MSEKNFLSEKIQKLADYLCQKNPIVCLTGAGISTESGIPDFRSPDGLYSGSGGSNSAESRPMMSEELFDIHFFERHPEDFYRAFAPVYARILDAKPNAGHLALAELEKLGKDVIIVTQNIDSLHTRAGSSKVWEIHGTLETLTCLSCGKQVFSNDCREALKSGNALRCECGGLLKPDITFYGESLPLPALNGAQLAMWDAKLLLILGTSMTVYPAAGLPRECGGGVPFVVINKTPTRIDYQADLLFYAGIGEILPQAVALLRLRFDSGKI